jgi:hypothetical protein
MSLCKHSILLLLLVLLFSLHSPTTLAASQTDCCARLYQGIFLPLACGQYLGGSVLTLPERLMRQMPLPQCGPVNMAPVPMMGPRYPFYGVPAIPGMPVMLYGYPMLWF